MKDHFDDIAAFPLCWPEGWTRAKSRDSGSKFGSWTVYAASMDLREELRKMGAQGAIVSTSVPLRQDGIPLAKPPVDGDPGAACYFTWKGQPLCIACDTYARVEYNLRGMALTIEAMRAIERHGSSDLLQRAFTGFAALPARSTFWGDVLEISIASASLADAEAAYRRLAKSRHPDSGGSDEAMAELNAAITAAREALK